MPAGLDDEYQQVKGALKTTLDAAYAADTHAFEHGAARSGHRIPCTIDHAHVHLVPAARSVVLDLPDVASWVPFDGSLTALADRTGGREYLLYEAPTGASPRRGHPRPAVRVAAHAPRVRRRSWPPGFVGLARRTGAAGGPSDVEAAHAALSADA